MTISSFHHITDQDARTFLEKAAMVHANILIAEPLSRNVKSALMSIAAALPSLLTPITARDISFQARLRLALYHWVLPVVPATFIHDGVVSTLRQRSIQDWKRLTKGLPFRVEIATQQGQLKNYTILKFYRLN